MPIYQFGYIVKNRREAMGLTQEELSEGICSVPTLSRIENGERMPSKDHYEMLLQRLGFSDTVLYEYVDERTLALHELKYKIRQAVILKKTDDARCLLAEYKESCDKSSVIDQQFIILHGILSDGKRNNAGYRIKELERAMQLTCPQFGKNKFPKVLSFEELLILNNIAGCYMEMQQLDNAISLLFFLKEYYESRVSNPEESLRTQPMILYNLSKCLGMDKRYDECVEICDLGIKIARETGRCNCLSQTLYNRAWALTKRNCGDDMEQAKNSVTLALYMAQAMDDTTAITHYQHFIETAF